MYLHKIKINNLDIASNIFIAPLAGYTNLPSRIIYRKQGNIIAYTEMVSAEGLNYNLGKSIKLIDTEPFDSPLGIQLFGANADRIIKAFIKIKNESFDLIDINCGCSVKKVLKAKSGAYLLKDPGEIYNIIWRLNQETDKSITLKIRSGWDNKSINFLEILDAAQSAKAALITFHPRTRSMLFDGKANWDYIKVMKEKSSIPVIGNGDIFTGQDAVDMIEKTNCDGIMLARGLIENPFLVEEVVAYLQNKNYTPPSIKKRINAAINHCHALVCYYGEEKGICEFRKIFRGYVKGLKEVSKLRQKITTVTDFSKFKETLTNYYRFYYDKNEKFN